MAPEPRRPLLGDARVALVGGAILLAVAVWFDDRRETRAEILENTRFVRQAVMDPTVKLKPFRGLNLLGAQLSGLPLGCAPHATQPDEGCTDLISTDLSGANLTSADLSRADLTNVCYGQDTPWPRGFDPPPSAAATSAACRR